MRKESQIIRNDRGSISFPQLAALGLASLVIMFGLWLLWMGFKNIVKPVVLARFQDSLGKYRDYFLSVRTGGDLDQKDIDRLLHPSIAPQAREVPMPKGVDPLTLRKVRSVFSSLSDRSFSAEEVAEQIGLSRSTARRYLEYLIGEGFLAADLIYGVVGRPERRYFRVT